TINAIAFQTHDMAIVEGKGVGKTYIRLSEPRKEHAQYVRDVSNRAHGRLRSAPQAFLVNNHGHAQVLNRIGVWLRIAWQEVANEHAKILEQQPLCFVGYGIKYHR